MLTLEFLTKTSACLIASSCVLNPLSKSKDFSSTLVSFSFLESLFSFPLLVSLLLLVSFVFVAGAVCSEVVVSVVLLFSAFSANENDGTNNVAANVAAKSFFFHY